MFITDFISLIITISCEEVFKTYVVQPFQGCLNQSEAKSLKTLRPRTTKRRIMVEQTFLFVHRSDMNV